MVKNSPASAGDVRDAGSIPGLGRSPGGGHGNVPQYSSLENPIDRGALKATVHGVAESDTTEVTWHARMIFSCVYVPHFLYPFLHHWTFGLLPPLGCCV